MKDLTRQEEDFLVCAALGIDRSDLILTPELSNSNSPKLRDFRERSKNNEPLAYITGYQPFMGLNITVDKNVLIPRPETELLVEEIAKKASGHQGIEILDIGTGSGAIAISLAKLIPHATIVATDISETALAVAKRNAESHGVNINFLRGDLFSPVKNHKFDVIVSNPPYIPTEEIENLDPNVKDYEPRLALDGGDDGLDIIRAIIAQAQGYLEPQGILIFEIGINQSEAAVMLLEDNNYTNIEIKKDYAGIPRIAIAHYIG